MDKNAPQRTAWALFALLGLAYLALMHSGLPLSVKVVGKLLPITVLLLIAWRSARAPVFLYVALVFSAGGDFLLALPVEHGFVMGLASFLVAQFTYAGGFLASRQFPPGPAARLRLAAVAVYGLALAWLLLPATGTLLLPVSVYLVAICAMACSAAVHRSQAALLYLGAMVFVASDSLIALDRFIAPIEGVRYAIMVTYYSAQGLLCWGVLSAARDSHQE